MSLSHESAEKEYRRWLNTLQPDDPLYEALHAMKENEVALYFSDRLAFGTAGLRGVMNPGTGAMNVKTVVQATRGFADYLLASTADPMSTAVVIACDSRNHSEEFARAAAVALAEKGITALLFDSLRPTPELSFAIRASAPRFSGTVAGINITASHNPKEYNGYKAYGPDGAQLSPEVADAVSCAIGKIDVLAPLTGDFDTLCQNGKIVIIGKEEDEAYLSAVLAQRIDVDALPTSDLSVVYTPLHGAGHRLVPEVLRRAGLKKLTVVPEQMVLDGSFPTVVSPNPENAEAFTLGIGIAQKENADLIVATDPDADRVGVAVRDRDGSFRTLTGNRVGALLLDYIISAMKKADNLPDDAYAVKSIVSTPLADAVCKAHGVKMHGVLTGFKYIGEVIEQHEKAGKGTFLLGFEESYGYLKGTYARDKDSVVASLLICEMAASFRKQGMSLLDASDALDRKFGAFREIVYSANLGLADGEAKKNAIMSSFRQNPPKEIGGVKVESFRDYLIPQPPMEGEPALPASDVLFYSLEGGGAVVIRPSGTEPKVKVYCMLSGATPKEAEARASACRDDMKQKLA